MGRKTKSRPPIAIDLFCGAGGLSLGFEQAGIKVVAAVESDERAAKAHTFNFPTCRTIEEDIRKLTGGDLLAEIPLASSSDIDFVIGGPPCQGFSSIGRRKPDDERNQLLFEFSRIVREIRPRYFVLENVPGLLFEKNRATLDSFLRRVRRAGYEVVEPIRVLNAEDFGVPQRRKRAFILGFRTESESPPDYPTVPTGDPRRSKVTVADAIGDLAVIEDSNLFDTDRYDGMLPAARPYAQRLRRIPREIRKRRREEGISGLGGCCRTTHNGETRRRFARTKQGEYEETSRCFRLESSEVAPTLRAGTGPDKGSYSAARPIHPEFHRYITTREAARLHSYPDWFEFDATKWHGFRQIGNSVPPGLAFAIAKKLAKSSQYLRICHAK